MTPVEIDQRVFRPLLRRAVLLPVLALVALCAVLLWQMVRMERVDLWVNHCDEVIAVAQQEELLLLNRESSTRGYAMTGSDIYLDPDALGRDRAQKIFGTLKRLSTDDSQQTARLREIEGLIQQWEQVREQIQTTRASTGTPPDLSMMAFGKQLIDQVQNAFAEFVVVENMLKLEREQSAREVRHVTLFIAFSVTLIIAAVLAYSSRKQLHVLSQNYDEALGTAYQKSQDLLLLNERFTTTLRSIGDGVIATDDRGCVMFMNAIAEQLTGWTSTEAVRRSSHEIFNIIDFETRTKVESPIEKALRVGEIQMLANDTVLIARDGREIHIEDSGAPIRNSAGRITGVVLVFRDVGERRAMEAARDSALKQLASILQATPDGVWQMDTQGRLLFVNAAGAEMLGFSAEELQGQLIHDLCHHTREDGTHADWKDCMMRQVGISGVPVYNVRDIFWRRDRTSFPVEYSCAPVSGGQGSNGVVVVFKDITAAQLTEQALLRSEKLAATGEMASAMAHEINNPLEGVTNVMYLLDNMLAEQPQAKEFLHLADQELRRISHIVQRTLGLYREAAQERDIKLAPLCREVSEIYQQSIQVKQLCFVSDCENDASVFGYTNEIRHTISNLLLNALEAAPLGGKVQLRIRCSSLHGVRGVCILIADNGPGIAAENLVRMYDAFFSTKGGSGSGMGLWIVRSVVERLSGNIAVRTNTGPSSYTVFRVFIPTGAERAAAASAS